jgi:multisubunit Na+/H+ antiporter MnhF subunit
MIEYVAIASMAILILALSLTLVRMIKGPSLPDKVVSLDLAGTISIGIVGAYIFLRGEIIYIDIIFIVSLLLFFGTVMVAKYLKKRVHDN